MDPGASDEDVNSDYGGSIISEFTSINTNTDRLLYSYEHGRRYQAFLQGRYGLPNDDVEQIREGVKHKLYVDYILEGQLFLAPIGDNPQKIVDLGTGVGFWAQDVAEHFPSARVIGTDLSPIQPHWTSPNVEFRVEDLEDEFRPWTNIYEDADFIHTRAVLQTLRHPKRLLERSFEKLRPGGWIECHEVVPYVFSDDGTADENHPLNALYKLIEGPFSDIYGWQLRFPGKIPEVLRELGFVDVHEKHCSIPLGRWHSDAKMREMGLFCQSLVQDWVAALLGKHEAFGLSADEANTLAQNIYDALDNPRIHARLDWIDCWAQKPLS